MDATHSDLTASIVSTTVEVALGSSKIHIAGTHTFRIQITTSESRTAYYSTVLTLAVQCGSSSTTMTFGSYPNSKAATQYIAVGSTDAFQLPYMESSLFVTDSATSCILDSATLTVSTGAMSTPYKDSGSGNTQIWKAAPASAATDQFIEFTITATALGGSTATTSSNS